MSSFTCCNIIFKLFKDYIKHLKQHQNKRDLLIQCNLCGQTSRGWEAFKKHYYRKHKSEINNFPEMCEVDNHNDHMDVDEMTEGKNIIYGFLNFKSTKLLK